MKTKFFFLLMLLSQVCVAQFQDCTLPICNDDACGPAFVTFSPSGQNVFCEGSVITLANTSTTRDFQIFYVDWGDGQRDTIRNYNNITHTYDYSGIDRCEEGPLFNQTICYVGRKTCADGVSCNTSSTIITVRLRPVARFSAPAEVCVSTPVQFSESSCNVTGNGYSWDFGDGQSSTERSPAHTYAAPGNYTVRLTVTNSCGSDTETRTLRVVAPPEAGFSHTPEFGCGPTVVDFKDQANQWSNTVWRITPADTNRWKFTDTLMTLNTNDIKVRFIATGKYQVTQRAFNACGEKLKTVEINIYQPPSITLNTPRASCDELTLSSADLGFRHQGEITGFQWTFTNGTPPSATGPSFSGVTFRQSGMVTLTISSPCGDETRSVPVTVATTAPISFGANPSSICVNATPITLQASPAGGQWSGNGISPAGLLTPTNLAPGNYTYTYSIGAADCPNSATLTIAVLPAVTAQLRQEAPVCGSLNYNPVVTYTGAITSYAWTFADGQPATSDQPMPRGIVFSSPGQKRVTIRAEGACGTDSDTIFLDIQQRTPLSISGPSRPLCSGSGPDTLRANVDGGSWSGEGIVDSQRGIFDPSKVNPGQSYRISYIRGSGACSDTAFFQVSVVASQTLRVDDALFCIDRAPTPLSADKPGGRWQGRGVDSISGVFDPALSGAGVFPVQYSLVDPNGCAVSARAQVTVEALPALHFQQQRPELCRSNINVDIAAATGYSPSPAGGRTSWSGPGIVDGNQGVFNAAALSPGTYTLRVRYERNDCVVSDSVQVNVVEAQPLRLSPDTTVCISDGNLSLQANLSGGRWSGGPGIDPISGRIDLRQAGGGRFRYTYLFQEGSSCEQSGAVSVEIIDLSSVVNAGPDVQICEGPVTFRLQGASPARGYWRGPGLIDSLSGLVDLRLLATDTDHRFEYCIESEQVSACSACSSRILRINAKPEAAFTIDGTACVNENFRLSNESQNAVRYRWDFGDGTSSTEATPSHRYTQPGTYTLQLIAESGAACRDTLSRQLFVTTPPIAAFTLREDEGCAPFELQITNTSSGDDISQEWRIGGRSIPGADPGRVVLDSITRDSLFSVVLLVRNLCGEVRAAREVLVHPYPFVRFGTSQEEGCSPLEIDFSNPTLGNPRSFFWDLGNGQTSRDSIPPRQRYTTTDSTISEYRVTLIAENTCGADTLQKTITVFPPNVRAFIEPDTLLGCQPLTIRPESFSTPGARLSWQVSDPEGRQQGSQLEAPVFVLNTPGIHEVVLFASNCGTHTDTVKIEVLPAPQANFTHRPFICEGQAIFFQNRSTGISGSEWDFGDGRQSRDASPFHVYDSAGTYTVTLTVYSLADNCPATTQSVITVVGNPVAGFSPSQTNGCAPLLVGFQNESEGMGELRYQWEFGDGSSASFERSPQHRFTRPGNYVVTLTVFDADSCFASRSVANILVFDDPQSEFSLAGQRLCLGADSLRPTDRSRDAVAYEWRFQGESQTRRDPVFQITQSGTFPLELIVKNRFECADTSVQQVTILDAPQAVLSADRQEGCEDLSVRFFNSSTTAQRFFWEFGNGNTATEREPRHRYTEPGNYRVILRVSHSNGCPDDTAALQIAVWPTPGAGFSIDKPSDCGAPADVFFTNTSSGSQDNRWDFGDGATSDALSPEHRYESPGEKTVRLIASNEFGCRDTAIQVLDIFGQPKAAFEISAQVGCEPLVLSVLNRSTQSLSYRWLVEGQAPLEGESPLIRLEKEGEYSIQLIAIYNQQCVDSFRLPVKVRVFQSPRADFSFQVNPFENIIGDVYFLNESQRANRYLWDLGDGTQTQEVNPLHEYDINRSIPVRLIAYNDNQGAYTCADTIQKLIDPEWITNFTAPNAFAPEFGEPEVRVFKPVGIGIQVYEIMVYAPWGQLVWRSTELENNQPSGAWDGFFQGQLVPQGAYKWVAQLTFVNGTRRTFTGTVTVLR